MTSRRGPSFLLTAAGTAIFGVACGNTIVVFEGTGGGGASPPDPATTSVSSSSSSSSGSGGTTTSTGVGGANTGGSGLGGECVPEQVPTEVVHGPLDVVLVATNGFNMDDELAGLEANINANFASVLQGLGVDLRVIAVSDHGPSGQQLCVPPPLSATSNCSGPPVEVPGQFFAYDVVVQTSDALCRMLNTVLGNTQGGQIDENGFHPTGWGPLLRPEATHALTVFAQAGVSCFLNGETYLDQNQVTQGQQVAINWDADLLSLAPGIFGTVSDRRYVFYSLVGMAEKNPAFASYGPNEPVTNAPCLTAFAAGTGYQWLSRGTEALRFPICQPQNYGIILSDLALDMAEKVRDPCRLSVPTLDDTLSIILQVTPSGGMTEEWFQVPSASACGPTKAFYYEPMSKEVVLCPEACEVVEQTAASLELWTHCPILD